MLQKLQTYGLTTID